MKTDPTTPSNNPSLQPAKLSDPPTPAAQTSSGTSLPKPSIQKELSQLRQQLGEVVRAKIISVTAKQDQSIVQNSIESNTRPEKLNQNPNYSQANIPANRVARDATGLTNSAQWHKIWQVSLRLAGLSKPVLTEFPASSLPSQWRPGHSLLLRIDPSAGLKIVMGQAVSTEQTLTSLVQSLARFVPIQGSLKDQLNTLIAATRQPNSHTSGLASALNMASRLSAGQAATATHATPTPPANSVPSADGKPVPSPFTHLKSSTADQLRLLLKPLLAAPDPSTAKSRTATQTANLQNLTPAVTAVLKEISKSMLTPGQSIDPMQLKAGMQRSGAVMEATLLAASKQSITSEPAKTAGLVAELKNWLQQPGRLSADMTAPVPSPLLAAAPGDLKALLLSALATTFSHLQTSSQAQQQAGKQPPLANWESLNNWLATRSSQLQTLQHPLLFPSNHVQSGSQNTRIDRPDAGEILRALAQSLARIQVNQLNNLQHNLAQQTDAPGQQVWFVELPILSQHVDTVQMRIEKGPAKNQKSLQQQQWKLILAFDFDQLGPLQSHVLYTDGTVSATFWAEQAQTLRTLTEELPRLRNGLQDWGISVGDIAVRRGQPPPPTSPLTHRLLDEKA